MSCRVLGFLQRCLQIRTAGRNAAEPWCSVRPTKMRCSNRASRSHVTCRRGDPTLLLPRPLDPEKCSRVSDRFLFPITIQAPLPKLVFDPFSITMATATPTCISTTVVTSKGCPTPTWLPTAMETGSVLKKRRRKMNQHKYKKWRKKHRFLRRRLGK